MKLRQSIVYLFFVMSIFLTLFYIEDLVIGYFLDYFFNNYMLEGFIFLFLNLIINPIVTNKLIHKMSFLQKKW